MSSQIWESRSGHKETVCFFFPKESGVPFSVSVFESVITFGLVFQAPEVYVKLIFKTLFLIHVFNPAECSKKSKCQKGVRIISFFLRGVSVGAWRWFDPWRRGVNLWCLIFLDLAENTVSFQESRRCTPLWILEDVQGLWHSRAIDNIRNQSKKLDMNNGTDLLSRNKNRKKRLTYIGKDLTKSGDEECVAWVKWLLYVSGSLWEKSWLITHVVPASLISSVSSWAYQRPPLWAALPWAALGREDRYRDKQEQETPN